MIVLKFLLAGAGTLALILITVAAALRCDKCGRWHDDGGNCE